MILLEDGVPGTQLVPSQTSAWFNTAGDVVISTSVKSSILNGADDCYDSLKCFTAFVESLKYNLPSA
jgi:hypothetical protein